MAKPFSAPFWACYLGGGVSDALDGPLARALNTQSAAGAKLDSAADLAFAGAIAAVTVRNIKLPPWLWALAGGIGGIFLAAALLGAGRGLAERFPALTPKLFFSLAAACGFAAWVLAYLARSAA